MATKEITRENVFEIDIKKLAMDGRFGSLVFENAHKKLSKIQGWLKETRDLKYEELLLEGDAASITSHIQTLVDRLRWLNTFDINAIGNIKQEHDNFERQADAFHNTVYQQVVMKYLPFLREERRRENPNERQTDEEVKRIVKIRSELENELKKVREETEKIRITGKDVGSAKGERAAVRLASHFDEETTKYQTSADWWFRGVVISYLLLVVIIAALGIVSIWYLKNNGWNRELVLSIVVTKLVIIAALWYGLSFIIKNYNVNSHLAAVNRHRAAVARTLEDFLAVEQQQEKPRLSEVLQNAAEAMFKNAPIGFISKAEKESGNPVLQIVNDLIGIRNNQ